MSMKFHCMIAEVEITDDNLQPWQRKIIEAMLTEGKRWPANMGETKRPIMIEPKPVHPVWNIQTFGNIYAGK